MADNIQLTAGTGTIIATDEVTRNAIAEHQQIIKISLGADGSFDTLLDSGQQTSANSVPVVVASNQSAIPISGSVGVSGTVGISGTVTVSEAVAGNIAHDTGDSGNPVKIGYKAINHGTNPTSVTANDRTDAYANRAGIPWVIGGHPNVLTLKHTTITTAVTNASIIAGAANTRIVVTRITATLDNASTVFPTVLIGFHSTTTPTTTAVLVAHGGVPAGGGFSIGDGSGILGIGAAADALLITTTGNATGNGLQICVSYYTINEA